MQLFCCSVAGRMYKAKSQAAQICKAGNRVDIFGQPPAAGVSPTEPTFVTGRLALERSASFVVYRVSERPRETGKGRSTCREVLTLPSLPPGPYPSRGPGAGD